MTRMLGRTQPDWCPHCNAPPGPDCPNTGTSTRQAKRREQKQTRKEIEEAAIEAFEIGVPLLAYLGAAASVRLDRDGQTYAIEPDQEDEDRDDH